MVDQLTEAQIAEFKEAFNLFDRDGDGNISTQELGTVIRSLGANPTNAEIRELISEVDEERTGLIDFPTFLTLAARQLQNVRGEDVVLAAFRVFDKENSGFVTAADIRHVLLTLGETLTADEVDRMIAEADTGKTGKINYVEYAKVLIANPA